MALREVVPDVYTWPWFSKRHGYNFNGHLVRHAGGNVCIDPVEADAQTMHEISSLGAAYTIVTNRNHLRAADDLRAHTGARTLIHPADVEYARQQGGQLDGDLQIGQRLGPFVVVDAAGKSPGEVALHWPERRLLIVGDAVIGNPPGQCSLLPEKVIDDPLLLRLNIRRLLDLDFDCLIVGDGEPILRGAKERLRELIGGFPN